MSPYAIEQACEEYRKQALREVAIYALLMTISGISGFVLGVMS